MYNYQYKNSIIEIIEEMTGQNKKDNKNIDDPP